MSRLQLRCACGWEVVGSEDEVYAAARDHGLGVHNMDVTREQALALATPVGDEAE